MKPKKERPIEAQHSPAKQSRIEWATHTFNCWSGCRSVEPTSHGSYAEEVATATTVAHPAKTKKGG